MEPQLTITITTKKITKAQQKKNRKKWIEALESGNYKKTVGILERDGKFCCLGVLASISGSTRNVKFGKIITYNGKVFEPDILAQEFVGMHNYRSLMVLNDATPTFKEVIELIKSDPPGIFI